MLPTVGATASPSAPPAGKTEPPTPLRATEKWLAGLLMVAGVVVTVAVLALLLTDGKWLIEETTTKGVGADKAVTTKKYSDTLPLAAVGVGGLLFLCGAFFGRLREVTLPGGAGIKLRDVKEKLDEKVEAKAETEAQQGNVDQAQVGDLKDVAHKDASARLLDTVARSDKPPAEMELDRIADQAVKSAKDQL